MKLKESLLNRHSDCTDEQITELARPLIRILEAFYDDPANREAFQKWKERRHDGQ